MFVPPDMGGHPHTLELYLERCVKLVKEGHLLETLDYAAVFHGVMTDIFNKYEITLLESDVVSAILLTAVLEDRVRLTDKAHPAYPSWTYRMLNDRGFLVLEAVDQAHSSFFVRLPFVWMQVYLKLLRSRQSPISDAFGPLTSFMSEGRPFLWQEFEDFNGLFMSLRINLLKLKQQMLPDAMPMGERVTLATVFKGALMPASLVDQFVLLPPTFVRLAAIGSLSERFPDQLNPTDDGGHSIQWSTGGVVVRNVAGGPQDHFFALLRAGGEVLPLLVNCQYKYTEKGESFKMSEFMEEYNKSRNSVVPSLSASYGFLFALFANRPAAKDFTADDLPADCVLVLQEQWRQFYGFTFFERAKFAATRRQLHRTDEES
jgi:hypothetical protein